MRHSTLHIFILVFPLIVKLIKTKKKEGKSYHVEITGSIKAIAKAKAEKKKTNAGSKVAEIFVLLHRRFKKIGRKQ